MTKYTAADFANAQFAKHENGQLATRNTGDPDYPWGTTYAALHDHDMADHGWVPVPTKPTLTESEVDDLVPTNLPEEYLTGFIDGFEKAGGTIIPNPEPTNTELIADALIDGFEKDEFTLTSPFNDIAAALATRGITAPNVKDN